MIVCICHRVSDRDIAQAVQAGTRSFDALMDQTLIGSTCGKCLDCARQAFKQACAKQPGAVGDAARQASLG
jgi:bacterioferritin-associated ferredoxin